MLERRDDAVNHLAGTDQVEGACLAPDLAKHHARSAQPGFLAMQLADEIEAVELSFVQQLKEGTDVATAVVVDDDLCIPKFRLNALRQYRVGPGQREDEMERTIDRFQQGLEFGPEIGVV